MSDNLDPVIAQLRPGDAIGTYTIVRKLGEGGMGVVFHARDPVTMFDVAIKILFGSAAFSADLTNRFKKEAAATNRIGHRGFVRALQFGDHAGRPYIVMEFLKGRSLGDEVREARIANGRACLILMQIADALQAAHDLGIIHRDLKPDNVFLLERDEVKILDLGIAKFMDEADGSNRTKSSVLIGTPHTMSPEQCRSSTKIDHRSDIYALGVVAYRMLAGVWPHDGEEQMHIITAHFLQEPAPLRTVAPWVSEELAEAVHRALAKDPAGRFQQMHEFREALAPLADVTMPMPANLPTVRGERKSPTTQSASSGELRPLTERPPTERPATGLQASPPTNWTLFGGLAIVFAAVVSTGTYFVAKKGPDAAKQAAKEEPVPAAAMPSKPTPAEPPPVTQGRVRVSTVPDGATVTVEGQQKGQTPLIISGKPGETVQVHLSLAGYEERLVPILVAEEDRKAEFKLVQVVEQPKSKTRPTRGNDRKTKATSGEADYMGNPFGK